MQGIERIVIAYRILGVMREGLMSLLYIFCKGYIRAGWLTVRDVSLSVGVSVFFLRRKCFVQSQSRQELDSQTSTRGFHNTAAPSRPVPQLKKQREPD